MKGEFHNNQRFSGPFARYLMETLGCSEEDAIEACKFSDKPCVGNVPFVFRGERYENLLHAACSLGMEDKQVMLIALQSINKWPSQKVLEFWLEHIEKLNSDDTFKYQGKTYPSFNAAIVQNGLDPDTVYAVKKGHKDWPDEMVLTYCIAKKEQREMALNGLTSRDTSNAHRLLEDRSAIARFLVDHPEYRMADFAAAELLLRDFGNWKASMEIQ